MDVHKTGQSVDAEKVNKTGLELLPIDVVMYCHAKNQIMYITKEELAARLSKTEVQIKEKERAARGKEKRLTHEERTLIGILEETDSQKNVAELVGVSAQTVSNVSRGLVSPTIGVDRQLRDEVNEGKNGINEKIKDALITNLSVALSQVANNIHNTKAPEAAKIAVDMHKILDRVSGNTQNREGNRTAIIINVPSMKEEKQYQTITV